MKKLYLPLIAFILFFTNSYSQVGIGTTSPDPSAMLDIASNTKGFLAPRMTSTERAAIATPANGLLVYDTTENTFYFYKASGWTKLDSKIRNNYKLVKSAADLGSELAAGGGSKYLLNTNTLYEINGTITLAHAVDLNNAYIMGLDTNEDKLVKSGGGNMFEGSTGGSIKGLTLSGGTIFNLTGSTGQNLVIRDLIVANAASVGKIDGYGMVFLSIVQFIGNATGITYSNIDTLLLSNVGWFSNNSGTYETFTGTFGLIEKVSGFSAVSGSAVAIDVSSNPNVGTGVLQATVFTGTTSAPSGYIKRYTTGSYSGFNFTNAWTVNAPGIPREGDAEATGDINLTAAVGAGASTAFAGTGTTSRKKIEGTTTSNNLFRFRKDGNNKIIYEGNKTRYFQVAASVSYQSNAADMTLIVYIAKNGAVLAETKVYGKPSGGWFSNSGILALPIIGTVQLKTDDYIEIWAERYEGTGNMQTVSLNLIAR
ncbi:MAG: hypothetical protein ABI295_02095 [Xanthomarina sp.]